MEKLSTNIDRSIYGEQKNENKKRTKSFKKCHCNCTQTKPEENICSKDFHSENSNVSLSLENPIYSHEYIIFRPIYFRDSQIYRELAFAHILRIIICVHIRRAVLLLLWALELAHIHILPIHPAVQDIYLRLFLFLFSSLLGPIVSFFMKVCDATHVNARNWTAPGREQPRTIKNRSAVGL